MTCSTANNINSCQYVATAVLMLFALVSAIAMYTYWHSCVGT